MRLSHIDRNRLSALWETSSLKPEVRSEIEEQLQECINSNRNISRKFFYQRSVNHSLAVIFIPTSDGYNNSSRNVTIEILLNDAEIEEIAQNISSTAYKFLRSNSRSFISN